MQKGPVEKLHEFLEKHGLMVSAEVSALNRKIAIEENHRGFLCEFGYYGKPDIKQAVTHYYAAAMHGDKSAQFSLFRLCSPEYNKIEKNSVSYNNSSVLKNPRKSI